MAAVAAAMAEREKGSPPNRRRGARSVPSSLILLIFSNLYLIGVMSLLLYVYRRHDDDGDPEPGEDSPSPAQAAPPASAFFGRGDSSSYVLPRLEGVKVGHKQAVKLVPNKTHFMKTLSLKPLAFEIPDFLSEDDCKLLIHLAKREGLKKSKIEFSKERADYLEKGSAKPMEVFNILDLNQDGQLQIMEMMSNDRLGKDKWLTPEDVQEMYAALKADPDGNGVLSLDEFKEVNMQDFYKYMDRKKANTNDLVRNSQQAWLFQGKGAHPITRSIQQRVIHLTRLPAEIVEYSERLQVVQYEQGGYYHGHWDSEDEFLEFGCFHTKLSGSIDLLHTSYRYATVLLYLNNVTGGGETTFPVADNSTYDYVSLIQNNIDLSDTYRYCNKGNLIIKPVQGTAIFWYNHLTNDEGWIGDLDVYSLHGGCVVTEGTKWIANQWIRVDRCKNRHLLFQKRMAQYVNNRDQSEWTVDKSYSDLHGEL